MAHTKIADPPAWVGVEGLPYAGKTTLTRGLERRGFRRLGELAEFYRNGAGFPPFSTGERHARVSLRWFVRAEAKRFLRLAPLGRGSAVVSDRTIVSSCAYTYARRRVYGIGDRDFEHRLFRRELERGRYPMPPLLYLRIPIETYLERKNLYFEERCRRLGRAALDNVSIAVREREFFEAQLEYYDRLAARLAPAIATLDGTRPPAALAASAAAWCRRTFENYRTLTLEDFLL